MSTTTNSNSRKVLVPLATLLVAGAVAVGSGATWTAESNSAITASSGKIAHSNSKKDATLKVTNLHPGATQTGSLTITNTGTVDSEVKVVPSGNTDTFAPGAVTLTVEAVHATEETPVYSGDFAGFTAEKVFGQLDAGANGDAITVDFTVAMAKGATDVNQEKSAGVNLKFVTTSIDDGDESKNSWVPFA